MEWLDAGEEIDDMLESTIAGDVANVRNPPVTRSLSLRAFAWRSLPLTMILTLQAVVALTMLHNTAFEDESLYLYAGRQLLSQYLGGTQVTDPFATYFSGHPDIYPLMAGTLDAIGGLTLARLLSLVAMLIATVCVYWIGEHLFGSRVAILGAATFALQGTVLFLSRLATYDALCLGLLAIAIVLAIKLSASDRLWLAIILGAVLVVGFFAKYVFLLWTPSVIAIIALESWKARGLTTAAIHVVTTIASAVVAALIAFIALGPSFIHALFFSTLQRQTSTTQAPVGRLSLLWEILAYGGIELGLGLLGALLAPRKLRLLAWLLVGSSILAPTYHLYHAEPVSLTKHLTYGFIFAAPLAGLAIQRFIEWQAVQTARASQLPLQWAGMMAIPIYLIIFTLGLTQAQTQFNEWPNSAEMTTTMRALVRPDSGHYLAEDMEVSRYYLQDVTADWQWTGPFWFEYTTRQHQTLYGEDAYKQAIHDGYFDAIELSFGTNPALDHDLKIELEHSANYQLVGRIFYQDTYGGGYYYIWRKVTPASS